MKTARFNYTLPEDFIAQAPSPTRDGSRLLVVDRATRQIAHCLFSDLPRFLRAGDILFRNTARVLAARLHASRAGGGRVECLLLRPAGDMPGEWWCLLRPGRKLPPGSTFGVAGEFEARVIEKSAAAEYRVSIAPERPGETIPALAERLGRIPLPPYIDRARMSAEQLACATAEDPARYQTVFADSRHTVAVAAPTAGLHFTAELLDTLRQQGVSTADIVLHVGLGTFRPIEAEEVEDHAIHREIIEVPVATQKLLRRPESGRRVAVGTTSLRAIETCARVGETAPRTEVDFVGETDLFIHPPGRFLATDALITNFHMPRSTLLCLVAAFLTPGAEDGVEWLLELYAEAMRRHYRFLSYGDAMLIV